MQQDTIRQWVNLLAFGATVVANGLANALVATAAWVMAGIVVVMLVVSVVLRRRSEQPLVPVER